MMQTIPEEVQVLIFGYLQPTMLALVRYVSKEFRRILDLSIVEERKKNRVRYQRVRTFFKYPMIPRTFYESVDLLRWGISKGLPVNRIDLSDVLEVSRDQYNMIIFLHSIGKDVRNAFDDSIISDPMEITKLLIWLKQKGYERMPLTSNIIRMMVNKNVNETIHLLDMVKELDICADDEEEVLDAAFSNLKLKSFKSTLPLFEWITRNYSQMIAVEGLVQTMPFRDLEDCMASLEWYKRRLAEEGEEDMMNADFDVVFESCANKTQDEIKILLDFFIKNDNSDGENFLCMTAIMDLQLECPTRTDSETIDLINYCELRMGHTPFVLSTVFQSLIDLNSLFLLEWCYNKHRELFKPLEISSAYKYAAEKGNIMFTQWFMKISEVNSDAVYDAINSYQLSFLEWFAPFYGNIVWDEDVVTRMTKDNRCDMLDWYFSKASPTPQVISDEVIYVISSVEVAEWYLNNIFSNDKPSYYRRLLEVAVRNSLITILNWLRLKSLNSLTSEMIFNSCYIISAEVIVWMQRNV